MPIPLQGTSRANIDDSTIYVVAVTVRCRQNHTPFVTPHYIGGQYKEYGYYWKRKTGYGGRFPISARDRSLSAITQPTTPSSFEDELNAVGEYYAPLANRYSFHIK